jgi:hypothetical protein
MKTKKLAPVLMVIAIISLVLLSVVPFQPQYPTRFHHEGTEVWHTSQELRILPPNDETISLHLEYVRKDTFKVKEIIPVLGIHDFIVVKGTEGWWHIASIVSIDEPGQSITIVMDEGLMRVSAPPQNYWITPTAPVK